MAYLKKAKGQEWFYYQCPKCGERVVSIQAVCHICDLDLGPVYQLGAKK